MSWEEPPTRQELARWRKVELAAAGECICVLVRGDFYCPDYLVEDPECPEHGDDR